MKIARILFAAAAAATAFTAAAQSAPGSAPGHAAHHPAQTAQSAPDSEGEVRKVDMVQGKVTLRHGPLENLEMPAMTMVFKADPRLLEGLRVGDKVRFDAVNVNGVFTVTAIQPAR